MALPQRIESEEEYLNTLERIVKGARKIEDPLTTAEERERYMQAYDHLCMVAMEYRWRERREDGT